MIFSFCFFIHDKFIVFCVQKGYKYETLTVLIPVFFSEKIEEPSEVQTSTKNEKLFITNQPLPAGCKTLCN